MASNSIRSKKPKEASGTQQKKRLKKWSALNWARVQILAQGDRGEILKILQEHYNYTPLSSEKVYEHACKLAAKNFAQETDKIRCKNLQRLEALIDATAEEDTKTALAAIDIENKMTGQYVAKVSLKNDDDGDTFKIKID